jgi:hypothetical protein
MKTRHEKCPTAIVATGSEKEKRTCAIAQTHHLHYSAVKLGIQVLFTPFYSFLYYFPSKVYARKPLYAKITMGDEDDKDQRTGI